MKSYETGTNVIGHGQFHRNSCDKIINVRIGNCYVPIDGDNENEFEELKLN